MHVVATIFATIDVKSSYGLSSETGEIIGCLPTIVAKIVVLWWVSCTGFCHIFAGGGYVYDLLLVRI